MNNVGTSATGRHASPAATARTGETGTVDDGDDPVTAWLLQRDDLDTTEFHVLFAIHKLRARRGKAGWITHGDLCRSTSLAPAALGRVLKVLRERGLVWMAPHPVKTRYARYLLIVQ
ncbi:MAG: MarR family winged helix-turn-helix transcriptional regulator [Halofilum sp. (in: g-proteobacteria)]